MTRSNDSGRVVVTGTGCICASGRDPQSVWSAVRAGRSSLAPIRRWDSSGWPRSLAGEVDDDARALLGDRKLARLVSRSDAFGLFAAGRAVEAAGAAGDALNEAQRENVGVFVGSPGGGLDATNDFLAPLAAADGDLTRFGAEIGSVNPLWGLTSLPNNVLCHVSIRHGFKGPNACFVHHNVGAALALGEAVAALRGGISEQAVVVAHDTPVEPQALLHFDRIGLLGDELRPFTTGRCGTVLGDGAAALWVETLGSARRRGVVPLAEVLAVGSACEATGPLPLRDDGDGVVRAIRIALDDAGLKPQQIGAVVAHANGTPLSDVSEAAALRSVFGTAMPPVTGFKWAFGHTLVAAALLDAVLAAHVLHDRIVPGLPVLGDVDPQCSGIAVSRDAQELRGDVVLALARGFGGANAAVLLGRVGG